MIRDPKLGGHRSVRPARTHPSTFRWYLLRDIKRARQKVNGVVECGTCGCTEKEYAFELHHRHYDNWGEETLADVILLCRPCHEAITNRIRSAQYTKGGGKPLRAREGEKSPAPHFRAKSNY